MARLVAAVVVGVLVLAPRIAPAQRAALAQVEPGARVRGQAPAAGMKRFDATVIANTGDTIVIAKNGEVTRLPVDRIRSLELYRGLDKKAGLRFGAITGTASGFLVGGYTGLVASAHSRTCTPPSAPPQCEPAPWRTGEIWAFTGGFTVLGALIGAGTGALAGKQRWERLTPARTSVVPVPGGVGIRIAIGR